MEPELVQAFLEKKSDEVAIAVALGEALGAELPEIDVVDFRKGGYLPEALVNFLALQGWSPAEEHANREIWSMEELAGVFSLDKVGKTAARFDRDKLRWMNGQYIRSASVERLVSAVRDYARDVKTPLAGLDDATLAALIRLYHERITTLKELDQAAKFFFHAPETWNPEDKGVKKVMPKGLEALKACHEVLSALKGWTEAEIEAAGTELANARFNGKLGELAQPLRVAVSGGTVSPPIWGTLAVLGREQTLDRIARCIAFFGA
jgi:glutamyl-tRNA synthetase